jgi:hypothetical protein
MLLEALVLILGYYLFCVVGTYGYAVLKSWEFIGVWNFKIINGHLGIVKIPKIFTFWMGKRVSG